MASDARFDMDESFNEDAEAEAPTTTANEADEAGSGDDSSKKRKVLTVSKTSRSIEAAAKRGVMYISRIPPHMKPMKLRQMLSAYGALGRVYCAPEDQNKRRERKRKGGNTGKNFTEGWVEFEDKKVAKKIAGLLNGQSMGGSRKSAYHYDLWCLKYLPKFKWDHLTEEITYQRAVREQRLEAEMSAAKRERDFYLSRVDRAKGVEAIKKRKLKKAEQDGGESTGGKKDPVERPTIEGQESRPTEARRSFGQRKAKADPAVLKGKAAEMSDDVLALISRRK
eukprot:gene15276-21358_t